MNTAIFSVLEFHKKMGCYIGDPQDPDVSVDQQLRVDLIGEEFEELQLALRGQDKHGKPLSKQEQIIAVADALGDIAYVVAGAAVTWGIDLAGVFSAIHDSNMTKTPNVKREDGKILKGPDYKRPDIEGALENAKREIQAYGYGDDSWWPEPTKRSQELRDQKFKQDWGHTLDRLSDGQSPGLISNPVGQFLARGAYRFDCACGRSHEVSTKNGTRGGMAKTGHAECICGKVFDLTFSVYDGQDKATIEIKDLGSPGANQ